jgi:hypothetical protein
VETVEAAEAPLRPHLMPQRLLEALTKLNPEIINKAPEKNQRGQGKRIFNTNSVQFSPPSELIRSEMSAFGGKADMAFHSANVCF